MSEGMGQPESGSTGDLLRAGISAAKAGHREHARALLMEVVERDEGNAKAWLWLSGVVDSLDDREVCLENVLTLDPDNDAAQCGLEWIREQKRDPGQPSRRDTTGGTGTT